MYVCHRVVQGRFVNIVSHKGVIHDCVAQGRLFPIVSHTEMLYLRTSHKYSCLASHGVFLWLCFTKQLFIIVSHTGILHYRVVGWLGIAVCFRFFLGLQRQWEWRVWPCRSWPASLFRAVRFHMLLLPSSGHGLLLLYVLNHNCFRVQCEDGFAPLGSRAASYHSATSSLLSRCRAQNQGSHSQGVSTMLSLIFFRYYFCIFTVVFLCVFFGSELIFNF